MTAATGTRFSTGRGCRDVTPRLQGEQFVSRRGVLAGPVTVLTNRGVSRAAPDGFAGESLVRRTFRNRPSRPTR